MPCPPGLARLYCLSMMRRCSSIILLAVLLPAAALCRQKTITVADIYGRNTFGAKAVPGFNSMKDGRYYTETDREGNLLKKAFVSGVTVSVLVKAGELRTPAGKVLPLTHVRFSDDESRLLILTEVRQVYRRSTTAVPWVFDLRSRRLTRVSSTPVMEATFSPDGRKVAYVRSGDLYYLDLDSGHEVRITADGRPNAVINGICDWVYEEEFAFTRAFQWSPQSDQIAYYRFDESRVPSYTTPFYRDSSVYPVPYTYKYPKAGEPPSVVSLHVHHLDGSAAVSMELGGTTDQYIPRIRWTAQNDTLCIYRMNRLQDTLALLLGSTRTGHSRLLYRQDDPWYIDDGLLDDLFFLKDGQHFIIVDESDGWQHAYLYDMHGRLLRKLTGGGYDIDQVAGVDEDRRLLYYTAALPVPMERQLFAVSLEGGSPRQLTRGRGWHRITFNADFSCFLDEFSDMNTPPVFRICGEGGEILRTLEDNRHLRQVIADYGFGQAEFLHIPNRSGVALNAWMLKPPDFDSLRHYPLLFMNYGGPGSQSVVNRWGAVNSWQQMLAQRGYVIVCVDNTGTGFRGRTFKKKFTYLRLGMAELNDQMDAARWLSRRYRWVDSTRIGHWGWSFGGFLSALAITKGSGVFSTAIAVAPVTDWRYYDNIYTERYMRTPQANPGGYRETSPIRFASQLKGKLLLIHGTADDNVHFQNSVMFSEALIQAGKSFRQAYYPNKNHAIAGGRTRFQLYTRMTDFLLENLPVHP